MQKQTSTKLIVALDVPTAREAREIFTCLRPHAAMFKIGSQLFTAAGLAIVREIVEAGGEVFLDLKFHDIPNTVAAAGREATRLGVSIFNVHASGGTEMMRRTAESVAETAARENLKRPRLIAVTVLTSHNQESLIETGVADGIVLNDYVIRLAKLARRAGLDGVVASVHETARIKRELGAEFLVVAPGVRPACAAHGDQRRVATPAEAVRAGADYIVVGRAILDHAAPARAVAEINRELEQASQGATPTALIADAL